MATTLIEKAVIRMNGANHLMIEANDTYELESQ
jgi:hypothetical protein